MTDDLTLPIITAGSDRVTVTSAVRIAPDDRAVAWAGPVDVRNSRDRVYLLGRYVHGGFPKNRNGHIFRTQDLVEAHKLVPHTALNVMHKSRFIVGANVAAELGDDETGVYESVVESLAVMWRSTFPEVWAEVQKAHDEGKLWYSMEAVCPTVQCAVTGERFKFEGPYSENYTPQMQRREGTILEKPLFLAGALVLPPGMPGWADADITELGVQADRHPDEAHEVHLQVAATAPHLSQRDAEDLTIQLVAAAYRNDPVERVLKVAAGFAPAKAQDAMSRLLAGDPLDEIIELLTDSKTFHFVGIPVPVDVAHDITGSTIQDPHVTIALAESARFPAATFERVVQEWAAAQAPFDMQIGASFTVFENGDERPFVADVESPGLRDAHADLARRLTEAGIELGGKGADSYHPHMTVKYMVPGETEPVMAGPQTIRADRIVLSTEDNPGVIIPFGNQ